MSTPTRYVPSENATLGVGVVVTVTVTGGVATVDVTVTGGDVTVTGGDVTVFVTVFVTVTGRRALAAQTCSFATLTHRPGFRMTFLRLTPAAATPAVKSTTPARVVKNDLHASTLVSWTFAHHPAEAQRPGAGGSPA